MRNTYDIIIVGAGVCGSFTARNLARFDMKILVLDKAADICCGTTRANSAIVHSGYSGKPGALKSKLTKMANEDFHNVCQELDVEFERIGSLMMAIDERGIEKVYEKYNRGLKNEIQGLEILEHDQALAKEPHLNPKVRIAMYAPTTGIVNPWEFGLAAMENAVDNGVELKLHTRVLDIKPCTYDSEQEDGTKQQGYNVITNQGEFQTRYVINCAGVYSDEINNLVGRPFFRVAPRKGEYILLDREKEDDRMVHHVIFQARDNEDAKGVIILPTVHGNTLVGPTAEDISDKEDTSVSMKGMEHIRRVSAKSIVGLPFEKQIRTFAGVRPRPQVLDGIDEATGESLYAEDDVKDFIIREVENAPGFINCAGIKSPGLTCANEIGKYIANIVAEKEGAGLKIREDYNPIRRKLYRFHKQSKEVQEAMLKENPKLGNMVCRCSNITEAEVIDAIHRNCGATTVDGVKRRVGTGMGRCQGGFCMPYITEILHRELGISYDQIEKDKKDSYIITGVKESPEGGLV